MKSIKRLVSIAAAFTFALGAVAQAAPKDQHQSKYFTVAGTVLQVDTAQHTLLVTDRSSSKLYLIEVPEGATFRITFGRYMRMREPGFDNVIANERVEIRCLRNGKEHLAVLPDNRTVTVLTAVQ